MPIKTPNNIKKKRQNRQSEIRSPPYNAYNSMAISFEIKLTLKGMTPYYSRRPSSPMK